MNAALLALFKLAKLLYPFVKESILGQDSVLTILRKRKVFVFIMVSNLSLFLTTAFLAEQNFILLDRLKVLSSEIKTKDKNFSELDEKNVRLLSILKGDLDEVCYAHVFGGKDTVREQDQSKSINYSQTTDRESEVEPRVDDQQSFSEE